MAALMYDVLATIYEFERHMIWRLVYTTAITALKNACSQGSHRVSFSNTSVDTCHMHTLLCYFSKDKNFPIIVGMMLKYRGYIHCVTLAQVQTIFYFWRTTLNLFISTLWFSLCSLLTFKCLWGFRNISKDKNLV